MQIVMAPTFAPLLNSFSRRQDVSSDCAKDMRKVVVHHMEGGHNILSFVESRGVEALSKLHGCHLYSGRGMA